MKYSSTAWTNRNTVQNISCARLYVCARVYLSTSQKSSSSGTHMAFKDLASWRHFGNHLTSLCCSLLSCVNCNQLPLLVVGGFTQTNDPCRVGGKPTSVFTATRKVFNQAVTFFFSFCRTDNCSRSPCQIHSTQPHPVCQPRMKSVLRYTRIPVAECSFPGDSL